MLAFCTVLCSCLGISVQTNITALVRLIAFLESWLCICHRFVYMYFSQTDSVFLSQILHISMWHHSGTGGRIRIFKRAKSIRIKFPKPWACCPTMEIICCSARPNLMPQNGSRRPLQSLKTDEHPPNEDLFFGRRLGNSFEYDHNHQHKHQSYHHHHILNIQGGEFKQFQGLPEPDFQSPNLSLVLCLAGGTSSVELVHFLKGRQPEKFSGKDSQR